jgi:hypothetical protein
MELITKLADKPVGEKFVWDRSQNTQRSDLFVLGPRTTTTLKESVYVPFKNTALSGVKRAPDYCFELPSIAFAIRRRQPVEFLMANRAENDKISFFTCLSQILITSMMHMKYA